MVGFWVVLPDVPDSVFPEGVSVSKGRWEAVVEPEQAEKLEKQSECQRKHRQNGRDFFHFQDPFLVFFSTIRKCRKFPKQLQYSTPL